MELQRDVLISPGQEVSMLEGELVATIRGPGESWCWEQENWAHGRCVPQHGSALSAAAYLVGRSGAETARELYTGAAGGNAVVVRRLLAEHGIVVSVRTIERAVADLRRARRAAEVATVRMESAPGDQLQIDFG